MEEALGAALFGQDDREKDERIKKLAPHAREVALVLVKTIKATKMYLPNNPIYQHFRDELSARFESYFKDEDLLSFMVKRFELTFLDQQVYHSPDKEENIALMFFKDGIREFCFHKGITPEEIDGFVDILKLNLKERELDDDLVTLLWEKDFRNITYTVTEESTDEEADQEEALLYFDEGPDEDIRLDEIRSHVFVDAAPGETGIGGYAEGESGAPGYIPRRAEFIGLSGQPEIEEEFEKIRGSYKAPDEMSQFIELTDIFYEILISETDIERFETVAESLSKALEIFVDRGDLALATILVMKVQELSAHPRLQEWAPKLDVIIEKACSAGMIEKVGKFIEQGGQAALESAGSYLNQLDERAIGPTVGILESVDDRKARKAICDILASQCGGNGKLFIPYLVHRYWFVVRNVVTVLRKVADPETAHALGGVLRNPDARVRREALYALSGMAGKKPEGYIADTVSDADKGVRLLAARLLSEMAPERAYTLLMAIAEGKGFKDKDLDEKKEIYELIGRTGGEKSIPYLAGRFGKKTVFGGRKQDAARALAACGLAEAGGNEAYGLLRSGIDAKSKMLRSACIEGLKKIKKEVKDE